MEFGKLMLKEKKENKHSFEISKMLGHTSIKTTFDVYGHLL